MSEQGESNEHYGLPNFKTSDTVDLGPSPGFVQAIYTAFVLQDMKVFDRLCGEIDIRNMRLLAQRLMRMSTEVRSLIDARMGNPDLHSTSHE